jgi:TonB family protein
MNDSFTYLLKVSAGLGIIFLPYYLLLRSDPNLVVKRIYLLLGLASAWIFPLITFRKPELMVHLTPTVFIDPEGTGALHFDPAGPETATGFTINWIRVWVTIYLSGLFFMLVKNLYTIVYWNLTWHKTKSVNGVAFTKTDQVFTLFTRIFIPGSLHDQQDLDSILLHEKAHVQQLHFIDLILMELTLLFTWFNPFSWLISRMMKENHEYLADRQVLSAGVNPVHYRAQLLNHTLGVNLFRLGNQFNHSITLKRFNMMKKPGRSPLGIMKIALLIPAILITLGLATGMATQQQKSIKGKVVFADTGEPAPGAAVLIAGTTTGTITDDDGAFMLDVAGDPEIVISFVGYATLHPHASEISSKLLKLKVRPFTVDPEAVPDGDISVNASDQEKADLLAVNNEVFYVVEEMPGFPGGTAALKTCIYSRLEYPETMKNEGISGEVYVEFLVNTAGKLEEIRVARSTHKEFEAAALGVFKGMPDWEPGKQRGKPVNVKVVVPVRFSAESE